MLGRPRASTGFAVSLQAPMFLGRCRRLKARIHRGAMVVKAAVERKAVEDLMDRSPSQDQFHQTARMRPRASVFRCWLRTKFSGPSARTSPARSKAPPRRPAGFQDQHFLRTTIRSQGDFYLYQLEECCPAFISSAARRAQLFRCVEWGAATDAPRGLYLLLFAMDLALAKNKTQKSQKPGPSCPAASVPPIWPICDPSKIKLGHGNTF